MARTGQAALDWAANQINHPLRDWEGWCLVFARMSFGVDSKYGYAAEGWQNAQSKHGGDLMPPAAVPVWWTGGSRRCGPDNRQGCGHVVVSAGNGFCYSTDFERRGEVNRVKIQDINMVWTNLTYRGWSEDINGVRIFTFANLPAVDLSNVIAAISGGFPLPIAEEQNNLDMLRVEHALQHANLLPMAKPATGFTGLTWRKAYAEWQKRTVPGPYDGIPGVKSLTKLGESSLNPFRVVP